MKQSCNNKEVKTAVIHVQQEVEEQGKEEGSNYFLLDN